MAPFSRPLFVPFFLYYHDATVAMTFKGLMNQGRYFSLFDGFLSNQEKLLAAICRIEIDRATDVETTVSRQMRKRGRNFAKEQLAFRFDEEEEEAKAFWQARFYDFNVYKTGKMKEKLNYMHANPVIRGLVKHPKDWPRSSWAFYMKGEAGLVPINLIEC